MKDIEKRLRDELQAAKVTAAERLAAKLAEAKTLEYKERIRKTRQAIIEDALYLRCPRCYTVFLDYEGCDALTCKQSSCGASFCALCLTSQPSSRETHQHLIDRHGGYYGTPARFQEAHKLRRIHHIKQQLRALEERSEFYYDLLREMATDLVDVGISAREFAEFIPAKPTAVPAQATSVSDIISASRLEAARLAPRVMPVAREEEATVVARGYRATGPVARAPIGGRLHLPDFQAHLMRVLGRELSQRERHLNVEQIQDYIAQVQGLW